MSEHRSEWQRGKSAANPGDERSCEEQASND